MNKFIRKIHPAILATIIIIAASGFIVLCCFFPLTFLIACVVGVIGLAWFTIYEAIIISRRFSGRK